MKTLGTKLDNEICQKFIECCNNDGQTVSEKIRKLIHEEIEFVNNCEDYDRETIDDFRKIRKCIGTHDEGGWTIEDDGTLRDADFTWLTDEEKKELGNGEKVIFKNKTESEVKVPLLIKIEDI